MFISAARLPEPKQHEPVARRVLFFVCAIQTTHRTANMGIYTFLSSVFRQVTENRRVTLVFRQCVHNRRATARVAPYIHSRCNPFLLQNHQIERGVKSEDCEPVEAVSFCRARIRRACVFLRKINGKTTSTERGAKSEDCELDEQSSSITPRATTAAADKKVFARLFSKSRAPQSRVPQSRVLPVIAATCRRGR